MKTIFISPEETKQRLPWAHIVTSNLKGFIPGTYHGTSYHYLQEYLGEFAYRLNRRFWEPETPNPLPLLCINHPPCPGANSIPQSLVYNH